MGSHRLFRYGAPFCRIEYGSRTYVQRLGSKRCKDSLLDFPYHASLDIETPLEPATRNVPYQEILCRPHPDGVGSHFRVDCLVASSSVLFAITIALFAIVAFSGATHDVACDGVYMDELNAQEQAKYIGWQGAFYNVAKIIGTGLLVYLAGFLKDEYEGPAEDAVLYSWTVIMIVLGGVMFALGLYHTRMLPSGKHAHSVTSFSQSMAELWNVIRNFFTKKHIVYYICFIILYRFAEGFVMKIVPLFLKAGRDVGGLGLTEQEIGIYYGTFGAAAFVLGSLLGGYYISARGLKKTLFSLCCVFNLPFMAYTLLAIFQPQSAPLIGGAIVLEYFGYGFGFVGLTLFMMQQVAAGPHQMAHYAFASGIMNLGVMLPGMMSGYVSDWLGYKLFFIFVLVAAIPAFLMTWFVPFTHEDKK